MEPDQGHDTGRDAAARRLLRLADWCQSVGAVLAVATITCVLLDVASVQQAVAFGLPSVVLIAAGLITAAVPDAATARRHGFDAGWQVGALLSFCRSLFHDHRTRLLAQARFSSSGRHEHQPGWPHHHRPAARDNRRTGHHHGAAHQHAVITRLRRRPAPLRTSGRPGDTSSERSRSGFP